MKKIILFIIFMLSLVSISWGIEQENIDYLNNLGINIEEEILLKKQVSRYEVTKYMNYAQCHDCMRPPKQVMDKFNYGWFQKFKQKDSIYMNDISPQDDYYYCVVPLADLDYIHGYPNKNPVCGGKFCGSNNVQYSELLQIVVNIISPEIWEKYRIRDVEEFYQKLEDIRGKAIQKSMNITNTDYDIAQKMLNKQKNNYVLENFDEFFLYQKYCNIYPGDCNFKEFGNTKRGSYSLSVINILYNEDMLSLREAINFYPQKQVSGEELVKWLYKIKKIKDCKIDNDYDNDGIENDKDNCMYTYNPSQRDIDGDGIGDVCDDDIDGDGVKNPIGIVDDEGNILIDKIKDNMDNCLFTKNKGQKDVNNNGIGDACENFGIDLIGIETICSPLKGNVPLTVKCTAKKIGDIGKVVRTHEGEVIGEGNNVTYIFTKTGKKKITATAIGKNGDTATADSAFKVGNGSNGKDLDIGFQVVANPTSGTKGTKIIFIPKIKGSIDGIKRDFGDGSKFEKPTNKNLLKKYDKEGHYNVIAKGIKDGKVVGISEISINIYNNNNNKDKYSGYLTTNPLLGYANQTISFTLETKNIKNGDIEKVVWNFGDGNNDTTKGLTNSYKYKKRGSYLVTADIYLKNGRKVHTSITEKIINNDLNEKYGAILLGNPLRQKIGRELDFKIIMDGFTKNDIKQIIWNFGDGIQQIDNNITKTHIYYKQGKKYVSATIVLKNGDTVYTSLTEVIYGQDICSDKEAVNKLKCDKNKDGIPDMCDNDIDGDGVKNLLGIIKFENPDCSINDKNIDKNRLKESEDLSKKGGDNDNCPFNANSDQIDSNDNGIGDACDNGKKDSDGDGIPDEDDLCPFIPEDFNGIEDKDGCPEIPRDIDNDLSLNVDNCDTCPCHYADYRSPFINGANIKAILVNPFNTNKIYTESQDGYIR